MRASLVSNRPALNPRIAQVLERQTAITAAPKQGLERGEAYMVTLEDQASTHEQKAGKEAADAVHESAKELRRVLDSLLQETLEVAARAARVDADMRSKEWVSRLLAMAEGRSDVKPAKAKVLASTLASAFQKWMSDYQSSASARGHEEVEKLIQTLQEVKGCATFPAI